MPSVGVHPHDAKLYDDAAERHLVQLATSSKKVIAWGEIGLDFYYDHSPRRRPGRCFSATDPKGEGSGSADHHSFTAMLMTRRSRF